MQKTDHGKSSHPSHLWRQVIILLIALVFLYVLLPQIKGLSGSFGNLRRANASFVSSGIVLTIITFFIAANMYLLLAKHRLNWGQTLLIQTASGFSNRLLPAGLGGIGLIAQYLRTQKHTTSEALTVVGLDNVIGIIGHFSIFFGVVIFGNVALSRLHLPHSGIVGYVLLALAVILIGAAVIFKRFRQSLIRNLQHISHDIAGYRHRKWIVVVAFINSLVLTLLYVGVLWCCSRALGFNLPLVKVLVVFTSGSIIGNATPTPGGLIGTEAGLFAGFIAYGASSSTALSIALLYRLMTYWLPIIPGLIAFSLAQKKFKLIG